MENIPYVSLVVTSIVSSSYATDVLGKMHYESGAQGVFDITHSIIPDYYQHEVATNYIPLTLIATVPFLPNSYQLAEEFSSRFLLICLLRAITIVSTILPKHPKCTNQFGLKTIFHGQAYDKIFSGHTSFVLLATLLLSREKLLSSWLFYTLNATEISIILATRSHYTVDVILACIITYLLHEGNYTIFSLQRT